MGGHRRGEGAGGGGESICACDPSLESSKKASVRHLVAGIESVPSRRYRGRSRGSCHRLGHRAHSAAHQGYWGLGHSGAMISMRHPSRAVFANTSSKRLNGGFAHRGPTVGGRWAWLGLHVPTGKEGSPPSGCRWGHQWKPFRGVSLVLGKPRGRPAFQVASPPVPGAHAHGNGYSDEMGGRSGKGQGHSGGLNGCWGADWAPPVV